MGQNDWWQSDPVVTTAPPAASPAAPAGGFRRVTPEAPTEPPNGYRFNPDGTASYIPGGPADPNRPGAPRPDGALTDLQRDAITDRYRATIGFERTIGDLQQLYDENLAGSDRGDIAFGIGGDRNIRANLPLAPTGYATFDSTAGRLIDQIMATFDITGGEANSIAELRARFGPYVPSSTDNDEQIASKIDSLRSILAERRAAVGAQLQGHGIPIPDVSQPAATPPDAATPPGARPPLTAGPGEQIDRGDRRVTAAGSEPDVALSHGDEQIDTGREIVNREAQRHLTGMLKSGATDDEIREYARGFGINVDQALSFRRTPDWQRWRRENPNQLYPFRDEGQNIPMGGMSSTVAAAASSPVGTGVIHAGNAAAAGTLPLVGDLLGQGEEVRLGLEASARENPGSALAGQIVGANLAYGGGGAVARALAPNLVGRLSPFARSALADVSYGALQGAGENGDPLSGAAESLIGGQLFRATGNTIGGIVSPTGGRLRALYDADVYPSVGQRFRDSGPLGAGVNLVEEASQSVPIAGQMVRANRQGARDQWERGAWNRSLGNLEDASGNPIQLPADTNLGPQAHQFTQQAFDDAYDSVRSRLSFSPDPDWHTDLTTIRADAAMLQPGVRRRFNDTLRDVENRITNAGGALNGDEFKAAASQVGDEIRRIRRLPNPTQNQRELLSTLEELDSALHQGARRTSPPEVVDELNRVDRGYAMLTRIEDASRRRPLEIGRFSPSDILQIESRNGGIRGRRFSAGEGLFTDYAQQGRSLEDVLPSSGTSERTAAMDLLVRAGPGAAAATAGGSAYMLGMSPEQIGGAMALPIMLNSPGARWLMAPRGGRAATAADFIRARRGIFGATGAATGAYGIDRDER